MQSVPGNEYPPRSSQQSCILTGEKIMQYRERLQKVNIADEQAACSNCGANILDIANFRYAEKCETGPRFREEVNVCKKCGTEFILRYDLFDEEGHIHPRVFSDDPNDPKYNWQDLLTQEQKDTIAAHLKDCQICNDRLTDEQLDNARFASILHQNRIKKETT